MAKQQNFPNGLAVIPPGSQSPAKAVIDKDGNVYFAGRMDLTGNQSITGNLSVTGTLGVTGASTLTGNTTVGGTFGVTGATTLTGAASLSSTLAVTKATTLSAGLSGQWAAFSTTLGVTGATTLSAGLSGQWASFSTTLGATGVATFSNRVLTAQGADAASANDLTLGNGNVFNITGTTDINQILTTGWVVGSVVYLKFTGIATLKNNQTPTGLHAAIIMGSGGDYISRANAGISLMLTSTATVPIWTFACDGVNA